MTFHFVSLALCLLALMTKASAQDCYLPNGTVVVGQRVCNPSSPFSACCAPGDECTTNGFCKAGNNGDDNWLWRESCTDKTWQSDLCPKYCYNSSTSPSAATINHIVFACSPNTYCCAYESETYNGDKFNYDCCSDALRVFEAGPANYLAGYSVTTAIFVALTSVSFPAGVTSPTTATGSSVTTTSSAITSSTFSTSTSSTTSSTSTSSLSTSNLTTVDKELSGLSKGAQAGIGVGVAIGGIALIGLGILIGLRLRRRKSETVTHRMENQEARENPISPQQQDWRATSSVGSYGHTFSEADSRVRAELEGDVNHK